MKTRQTQPCRWSQRMRRAMLATKMEHKPSVQVSESNSYDWTNAETGQAHCYSESSRKCLQLQEFDRPAEESCREPSSGRTDIAGQHTEDTLRSGRGTSKTEGDGGEGRGLQKCKCSTTKPQHAGEA